MMKGTSRKRKYKLLSFKTILEATKGDPLAIEKVLEHFKGYIITLSTRKMEDKYGNTYSFVDESIYRRLELKLITAVVTKFKINID